MNIWRNIKMGNKEKILSILKKEPLNSKEISEKLDMDNQMVNVYIQRLKEKDLIKQTTDFERYNKYIAKNNDIDVYRNIIKKFIPQFMAADLDIDFTDREFEIVKELYEEV